MICKQRQGVILLVGGILPRVVIVIVVLKD
jgi:hypothetical protein